MYGVYGPAALLGRLHNFCATALFAMDFNDNYLALVSGTAPLKSSSSYDSQELDSAKKDAKDIAVTEDSQLHIVLVAVRVADSMVNSMA